MKLVNDRQQKTLSLTWKGQPLEFIFWPPSLVIRPLLNSPRLRSKTEQIKLEAIVQRKAFQDRIGKKFFGFGIPLSRDQFVSELRRA